MRPYFPHPPSLVLPEDVSVDVCVRVSPQSDVPNLGAKAVLVAPSNAATQISPPARRGFDVTATLLAAWRLYATNRAADARPGRPQAHRRTP